MFFVDGYKMFKGTAVITTWDQKRFTLHGTWLYRPDTNCWYCVPDDHGFTHSYPAEVVSEMQDDVG